MTRVNRLQASFEDGEIGPDLYGRIDLEFFRRGLKVCKNFIIRVTGGVEHRPGTRFVLAQKAEAAPAVLIPFIFSRTDAFVLELSASGKARIFAPGGSYVESAPGVPYEFDIPWSATELGRLQWAQAGDDLHVVSGARHRQVIGRFGPTDWQVAEKPGENGPYRPWNVDETKTISASGHTGSVTLTASGFTFDPDLEGMLLRIEETDHSQEPGWLGGLDGETPIEYTTGDRVRSGGRVYQALNSAEAGTNPPIHVEGTQSSGDGKETWKYLHSGMGTVRITAVAPGGATAAATVLDYLPDSLQTSASYRWAEGAWGAKNGYPGVVGFFDLRLMLGQRRSVFGSVIDDFENFQPGTDDDLAIGYTITSRDARVDDIVWFLDLEGLALGTVGAEFLMRSSRLDETLTPTNRTVRQGTSEGSEPGIPAIAIDTVGLFVAAGGQRVHEFAYDPQSDRNSSIDRTLRSSHITGTGVIQTAWQQQPWRCFWAVREDGILIGLTYRRDENVFGWHRHVIAGGAVESIAVVPTADGKSEELWMTVRRAVDGATRRYIELMQPRPVFTTGEPAIDAWYLDCALKLESGTAVSTVSGLDHLDGEEVVVFADGARQDPRTVVNGEITLEVPARTVLVGLYEEALIETLNGEFQVGDGDTAGELRRVKDCVVRAKGVGGEVQTSNGARELLRPTGGGVMDVGPPVYEGLLRAKLSGGWTAESGVVIRQPQPFPLDILGLSVATEISEGR